MEIPIPDFQSVMLPLLRLLQDGQEHSVRDVIARLEDEFGLTEEERKQLLPSGQQPIFHNRVSWARTHLKVNVVSDRDISPGSGERVL